MPRKSHNGNIFRYTRSYEVSKTSTGIGAIIKAILLLVLILLLVVSGYVTYVFLSFDRLPDNQNLDIIGTCDNSVIKTGKKTVHHLTSWNVGFGAFTDKFSFFMDGGTYSRALSEEETVDNINNIISELDSFGPELMLIQELDFGSTRSYNVDEVKMFRDYFGDIYQSSFGVNYNSPYLLYPVLSPVGTSRSGMMTLSKYDISSSIRRSLPIQTDIYKLLDLDRAYTVSRISTSNGKELVLINLHLSAYTTDSTIVKKQLQMIYATINDEYSKGNYVICGGDFNMDLLYDSESIFGIPAEDYSWANPFPEDSLPGNVALYAPFDPENPVPSCRNTNAPWDPETVYQLTVDGFLVTNNIKVTKCEVTDQEFKYSDHQPVHLYFTLK